MKIKRMLVVLVALLIAMTLFACNGDNGNGGNGSNGTDDVDVPILDDLTNYSTNVAYYDVQSVSYGDVDQQISKLEARQEERPEFGDEDYDDLSVPLKIFVNSDADEIIRRMSQAGLSREKMIATVDYIAGEESLDTGELDTIVATGEWVDNPDWSFFDDWDYLEKLEDKADESGSTNDDSDNVQRQRRKMMRQIFEIGMTGDEFGRFVMRQMLYAMEVTETMHLDYDAELSYDEYVKEDLSFDALVYFKAFEDFVESRSQTVQLYGYYYDYNKAAYEAMDDETFEKELQYRHQKTYTNTEFLDYVDIQRNNYISSYRYSYDFYREFYQVHFQFQGLLEEFDLEVFEINTAFSDPQLKYSREMQRGMDSGFAQQLTLMDHLYVYTDDEDRLIEYNTANTEYEQVRLSTAKPRQDEKKMLLQYQQLKVADYILGKMNNTQLSNVLRYHILSYSGDMIRNIQSEKKDIVLEQVKIDNYLSIPGGDITHEDEIEEHEITIGRTDAIVAQIVRSYGNANPQNQFNIATNTSWDNIRTEVKDTLEHDYTQYSNGTEMLEAFEDLLIKKKEVNPDGSDYVEGVDDSALIREEYDTTHSISRFLNSHEEVLRYSLGQVKVEIYGSPGKRSGLQTAYNLGGYEDGTYSLGNNGVGRTFPDNPSVFPNNYPRILDEVSFKAGMTLEEGLSEDEANQPNFLTGNDEKVEMDPQQSSPGSGQPKNHIYVFEGWYIDIEQKYKVDPEEKVKYDMILYPGYTVTKEPVDS